MRASLDTNVVIHFYRGKLQHILFEFFKDGVLIYEQIRNVELEHHGMDILDLVDKDINLGNIEVYTDEKLKNQAVYKIFKNHVYENQLLYGAGDLGEVYAISLAQTMGVYSLVTDDTKQGGPYMSLLQLDYDVMPFTFADILVLRYLLGGANEFQTINDFNEINTASNLNWSLKSQIKKFIKRFWQEPYKEEEKQWMQKIVVEKNIRVKSQFAALSKLL